MRKLAAVFAVLVATGLLVFSYANRNAAAGDKWEYAELRMTYSTVEGKQFVIINCPAVSLSIGGEASTGSTDSDRYYKEALAKIGGTGNTLQDRMGSLGWELVTTVKDRGSAVANRYGSEDSVIYYFKRAK